jgi:hypothetical protein
MSRRKTVAVAFAAVSLGSTALMAVPAFAANTGSTNVTFALSGTGLAISIPSNADIDLGTATTNVLGTTASGSMNPTTVTDTRGAIAAAWGVTVSSTGFVGSGTAAGQSLAPGNAQMYVNVLDLTTLVGLATGGLVPTSVALVATPVTLSSGGVSLLSGLTTGSGTITYTPAIKVTIPASTVAGTYTAAVTQTVS